jgi:hypothetical protein
MRFPMNIQEFYKCLDEMCLRLRKVGRESEANRVWNLLHKVAWTSASELLPELEIAFRDILANSGESPLPRELESELAKYVRMLDKT